MSETYRWHPGARGLNGEWDVPVTLLPDELFSSCLLRMSLAQGCPPLSLAGLLWPRWRPWTTDLDRQVPKERLDVLVRASGIPLDAACAATLAPTVRCLSGKATLPRDRWPWITTLGSRGMRRRGGLQYCPACLGTDHDPFFRLYWRFAWHTACERHMITLHERCPSCSASLEPHRLDLIETSSLAECTRCGKNLSGGVCESADPTALAFQNAADAALVRGTGNAFGRTLPVARWFALAAFAVRLARRSCYPEDGPVRRLFDALGASAPSVATTDRGVEFESARRQGRQVLLASAWPVLTSSAKEFSEALKTSKITRQGLRGEQRTIPEPLNELSADLPSDTRASVRRSTSRASGPRSRRAVETMMARLERRLSARSRS